MKKRLWTACLITAALHLPISAGAADSVVLNATEWPPYSASQLANEGAASAVAKRAFERLGITATVAFMPWKRAIATAKKSDGTTAYFPAYHCNHVDGFVASQPIGTGPLGFAEHVDDPITWTSLSDIGEQGLKIGTVRGYANTEEFDQMVGTGWIRAVPAQDDVANLISLAKQRVDATIVDRRVLGYLLNTVTELQDAAGKIQFDERVLEDKNLHVCFVDSEAGRALRDEFDRALAQTNVVEKFNAALDDIF